MGCEAGIEAEEVLVRFVAVALAVAGKDLRGELRGRELLPGLAQFVLLALVIANFAFDLDRVTVPRVAPGVLWLVLVFTGLVAFGRTFAADKEQGTLEAMLLTGVGAGPIFAGKALAAGTLLAACEVVLLMGMVVLLGAPVGPEVVGVVLAATVGVTALGSLFAALAAQTRARELLLPALALPLWLPLLIVGARAAEAAMSGAGLGWQPTLVLLDLGILFWVAAVLAARFVLEE